MNDQEIRRRTVDAITVSPQMVVLAKARILVEVAQRARSTSELISMVLAEHGFAMELKIEITHDEGADVEIRRCAEIVSWREACVEAVWGLITDQLVVPADLSLSAGQNSVQLLVKRGGSSSLSSFDLELTSFPARIGTLPSARARERTLLSSGDLYLLNLKCPNMHLDIQEAAREAIGCFRRGFFSAAVALIGKVSEGAWIELGEALVDRTPDSASAATSSQRSALESPHTGPMQKIKAVRELLLRDEFKPVRDRVRFQSSVFEQVIQWSDLVRGSRNAIHFGALPPVPTSYETVGILLLAAQQHLALLYTIRAEVMRQFSDGKPSEL